MYENSYKERSDRMLENLEEIRKGKGVSLVDIADLLEVKYQTVSNKINGDSPFQFDEALLIQRTFFPEYELTYLFKKTDKQTA